MMGFLEFWKKLEELKSLEDKPEIIILILCIPALLYIPQILSKFITNINNLFDQVSEREFLKTKEIYNDSLTNELIKNVAKRRLDALQFRKITRIRTSPELIDQLYKLIKNSKNPQQTERDIRISSNFLTKGYGNFPSIRPEKRIEIFFRYSFYFYALFFLCLSLLSLVACSVYESPNNEIKTEIFLFAYSLNFGLLAYTFWALTAYFSSLKRIKEEIDKIRGYTNSKKKEKRSWLNILKRKSKSKPVVIKNFMGMLFLLSYFPFLKKIKKKIKIIRGNMNPQKKKRRSCLNNLKRKSK